MIDVAIFANEDCEIKIVVHDDAGNVKPLSGVTVRWALYDLDTGEEIIIKTTDNGIEILSASDGIIGVNIDAADTANLMGRFGHKYRIIDHDDIVRAMASGIITIA